MREADGTETERKINKSLSRTPERGEKTWARECGTLKHGDLESVGTLLCVKCWNTQLFRHPRHSPALAACAFVCRAFQNRSDQVGLTSTIL